MDPENNHCFVSWIYTRAVLRHASLLYAIWAARGWGLSAFAILLQQGLSAPEGLSDNARPHSRDAKRLSYNAFDSQSSVTGVTRATIASLLAQAHGPWLLHLNAQERIAVLERIASMYSILGYLRKEAYVLREVLGCVMDLIVCGREEVGGARIAGAGLGIQGVDLGNASQPGSVAIRTNDVTEGNESVLRIVKHVCKIHGIDLEAVKLHDESRRREPESSMEAFLDGSDLQQDPYGWPELQIGIVREAIAVAESLPGPLT